MTDTPLDEIEYDRLIHVIVNGRRVKRFFKLLYCEWCGKQLTARLITSGARKGLLYSSQSHNKRVVCNAECQCKLLSNAPRPVPVEAEYPLAVFAQAQHKFLYERRA